MELFIIRHGQSVGNTVQEDMPDCELTGLGRNQAETVARCMRGAELTHIVSSPLIRAIETAMPLSRATGLPVRIWSDLYEVRNRGPYRGPTPNALEKQFDGVRFEDEVDAEGWFCAGDENAEMAHCRAGRVLERLRKQFPGDERVALFAHGGFNWHLLSVAIGLDHRSAVRFTAVNGSIYWVRIGERGNVVEYIGGPRPLFA